MFNILMKDVLLITNILEGIVVDNLQKCDILLGVKEVPIDQLIANKTYFFFSHTIKKQPYNRNLLKKMIELNIRMIDYEALLDQYNSSDYLVLVDTLE